MQNLGVKLTKESSVLDNFFKYFTFELTKTQQIPVWFQNYDLISTTFCIDRKEVMASMKDSVSKSLIVVVDQKIVLMQYF